VSDLYGDVMTALTTGDPGVQRAQRRGGEEGELLLLRAEVRALQRTVALLARALERSVLSPTQADALGRELARHVTVDELDASDDDDDATAGVVASPYRGGVPGPPGLRCAACGKPIDPDDPELRNARGRVCTLCFQRG
jgi:hypothetical protein